MGEDVNAIVEDILAQIPEGVVALEARHLLRRAQHFVEEDGVYTPGTRLRALHVAEILASLHAAPQVIVAGMLCAACLAGTVTSDEIGERLGGEIRTLIDGVVKIEATLRSLGYGQRGPLPARGERELENIRKMLLSMSDPRAEMLTVKLAGHLQQVRGLRDAPDAERRRAGQETFELFAPLANRLGIWRLKSELEDFAFRYLYPQKYRKLALDLRDRKDQRQQRVELHRDLLKQALIAEGILESEVTGRPKHIYSIYRKMLRKNVPLEEIYDREGLRVILSVPKEMLETSAEEDESVARALFGERFCYQTLAIVHNLWKPIPGEFDNYIANPKPNGYQSLHTAVWGEDGKPLEIQIRTQEMHRRAEFGKAAHWRYKEPGTPLDKGMLAHLARMRGQPPTQEAVDAAETPSSLRDTIFVLTPQRNVFEFPRGATPIDFAYRVHTELGHTCRGAKVNGAWVPLDYQLQMGDEVKVITGRKGGPSRDWLHEEAGFVATSRARQKIRQWFRHQQRDENIAHGRVLVEHTLKRIGAELTLQEVAGLFEKHYPEPDDFFNAVGMGDVTNVRIENRVREWLAEHTAEPAEEPLETQIPFDVTPNTTQVRIDDLAGSTELLTRLAHCCNPLPGDPIIGYVTRGRGVTIHRRDCINVQQLVLEEKERLIEVSWGDRDETLLAQVIVKAYDSSQLLQQISEIITLHGEGQIYGLRKGPPDRDDVVPLYITLQVTDLQTLNELLLQLREIPKVIFAHRLGA